MSALRMANAITKALLPDLYGQPGITQMQLLQLMGTREIVEKAIIAYGAEQLIAVAVEVANRD